MEKLTAMIGLLFLATGFLLLVISIHKGKRIVEYVKRRYPQQWDDMGNPAPVYLQSLECNRWNVFIRNRKYMQFDDQKLTEMEDAQRKLEKITLAFVAVFILAGGIPLWFK